MKKGDVMFKIAQTLYKAKRDAKCGRGQARATAVQQKQEVILEAIRAKRSTLRMMWRLLEAKLARARANAELAQAELDFTNVKAPFDGIVDRLHEQLGSLVKEGDILTTLSDNSEMWAYFNVPEKQYLEYMASSKKDKDNQKFELELANHARFPESCVNVTVEGQFNNQTGNIPFRADFTNPDGLLRHGQTGTILIHRKLQTCSRHPAAGDVRDPRQAIRLGRRQG